MIGTEITRFVNKKSIGLAFFLGATMMNAQEKQSVSGKITDSKGVGVPYVYLEFHHKTNKSSKDAVLTDEKGNFSISLPNGTYEVEIEAFNFQKKTFDTTIQGKTNLGTITLTGSATSTPTDEKQISEVVITARSSSPYKVDIDKKVYNVEQDLTSKGGSLQDVLSNVPSVNVESDGSVSMRGNSNVRFLINGKPSSILGISDDSTDALKNIPADQIERIEIITNPSSKFEAEGTAGILNIILKKNTSLGFNGSVNASLGYYPSSRLNTNLNWNYGKWNWFVNGGGGIMRPKTETHSDIFYKNTGETLEMSNLNKPEFKNYNFNAGVVHSFTDDTSVNASITMNNMFMDLNSSQRNNSSLTGATFRNTTGNNENRNIQVDAGFDHKFNRQGHQISLSGSYQNSKNESENFIADNRNSTQTLYNYLNISNFAQQTWIAKLDYELPIGENSKLEAGARFDAKDNDIITDYAGLLAGNYISIDDVTGTNNYKEKNTAFYAQFKSKIGDFGYQLGLRNENINIDIETDNAVFGQTKKSKSYTEFFPSVFLSYDITDRSQFSLNYSRRIQRPRGFEIIPMMRMQNDPNRFMGNADLNPSFVNSFELGYTYTRAKWNINPTLYYQHTSDGISFVTEERSFLNPITGQETEYILSTPYNLGSEDRYGLDLNYSINPTNWLRLFGNVNIFRYKNETTYNENTITNEGSSAMARLTVAFRIDRTLNIQLQGHYRGGQRSYTTKRDGSYSLNFGLSKNIWNNTGTISFSIQDIFNSRKFQSYTDTESFTRYSEMQMMPRTYMLSFSYRFKNKNAKEPRPQQRRNQNSTMGDDESAMGGVAF